MFDHEHSCETHLYVWQTWDNLDLLNYVIQYKPNNELKIWQIKAGYNEGKR